jgi:4-hydroxy-tetrahydrodipicolinate reductase
MANLIAGSVREEQGLALTCRLSPRPAPAGAADPVLHRLRDVPGPPPVIVDFTARELTCALLTEALSVPCGLVIGTSGLTGDDRRLLHAVGRLRAVVQAANFSAGLVSVSRFVAELAGRMGEGWAAGVVDVHFAGKRDRPSATAALLAERWTGQRPPGDSSPDVAAFRIGDGVSEHRVLAAGPGEQIEVTHRVLDRRAFVPAVLRAVRFADRADPGVYSLEDVLC